MSTTSETAPTDILQRLEAALAANELVAQATLLSGAEPVGAKLLVFAGGEVVGSLGAAWLDELVRRDAAEMMGQLRGSVARSYEYEVPGEMGQRARVFIEVLPPPPRLVIFGGVHIALPLAAFAKILGFRVVVADPRSHFANRERFPEVDLILAEWPEEAAEQMALGPADYCVILTHDPKIDEPALKALLSQDVAYVGAIGSRATHAERFERMARQGVSAEALSRVYAPIGLDLKAETPEEIALAIMAEIVAVRRGGRGGFLKDRGARTEDGGR
ncbi:MAG TPA: XdhC/CoxI family protein [Ardenticatenaceae bacterium]